MDMGMTGTMFLFSLSIPVKHLGMAILLLPLGGKTQFTDKPVLISVTITNIATAELMMIDYWQV